MVVLEILFQVLPPSVEYSHLTMPPVSPLKVNVPLFEPLQAVALPEIVPPAVAGLTVTVAVPEYDSQPPDCTTER